MNKGNNDSNELKLGVSIDAENISSSAIELILFKIATLGNVVFKRIYGDFSHPTLSSWKTVAQNNGLQPIQCFRSVSGKSNSDIALVIDAMDWLHEDKIDGVCIVTSDSDFAPLAVRLKEAGLKVYGFGEDKTHKSFKQACHRFYYLESLKVEYNKNEDGTITELDPDLEQLTEKPIEENISENTLLPLSRLKQEIKLAIQDSADESGYTPLSTVGHLIGKRFPDFSSRNYGYKKLIDLINNLGFESCNKGDENKTKIYISIKKTKKSKNN